MNTPRKPSSKPTPVRRQDAPQFPVNGPCNPDRKDDGEEKRDSQPRNPPHGDVPAADLALFFADDKTRGLCTHILDALGNPNPHLDAHDVQNNLVIKALRNKFAKYDPTKDAKGGYRNIVIRNECRDFEKKRRRRQTVSLDAPLEEDDKPIEIGLEPIFEGLQSLMINERESLLHRALEQLSERERAVLSLKCLAEMTHAEITKKLKIPVTSIAGIAHQARQKLRGLLGEDFLVD